MPRRAALNLHPAMGTGTMYKGVKTSFRLVNRGCTNRPFYHIVVAERFREVKDQAIEQVGSYDPFINIHNEHLVALNFNRIQFWLKRGTVASDPVANIFGLAGLFPISPQIYMRAWRNRAKAEMANSKTEEK